MARGSGYMRGRRSRSTAPRTARGPAVRPLERIATRACGAASARAASTRSTTTAKRGCSVGSPLPEKVIQSGGAGRRASTRVREWTTSSGDGQREPAALGVLNPHWQYGQSNEQILERCGRRFRPRLTPSRRDRTGPYTVVSHNGVASAMVEGTLGPTLKKRCHGRGAWGVVILAAGCIAPGG